MGPKSNLDGLKVPPITSEDESIGGGVSGGGGGPSIQAIVHHVTGLPKCRLLDKMDVYVQLECGGERVKTKTRRNNTEKIYYEEDFSLPCGRSKALTVKLIDQVNYSKLTRLKFNDIIVATAYIDFDTVLQSGGNIVRQDFVLTSNRTKIVTPKVTLSCNIPREALTPKCTPAASELDHTRRPSLSGYSRRDLSPPTISTYDTAPRVHRLAPGSLDPSRSTSNTDVFSSEMTATTSKIPCEIPPFPNTEMHFTPPRDFKGLNNEERSPETNAANAHTGDRPRENSRSSPSRTPVHNRSVPSQPTGRSVILNSSQEYTPARSRARSNATEAFLHSGDQNLDTDEEDLKPEPTSSGHRSRRTPRHKNLSPTGLHSAYASPRSGVDLDGDFIHHRRSSAARAGFVSTRMMATPGVDADTQALTSSAVLPSDVTTPRAMSPRRNLSPNSAAISSQGVSQRHTSLGSIPAVPRRNASPSSNMSQRNAHSISGALIAPQRNQSSPSSSVSASQRGVPSPSGSGQRGLTSGNISPPHRQISPSRNLNSSQRDPSSITTSGTHRSQTPTKAANVVASQRANNGNHILAVPQRTASPTAASSRKTFSTNRSVSPGDSAAQRKQSSPSLPSNGRGEVLTGSMNRSGAHNRATSPRSGLEKTLQATSALHRSAFAPGCIDIDTRVKASTYIPRKRVAIDESMYN